MPMGVFEGCHGFEPLHSKKGADFELISCLKLPFFLLTNLCVCLESYIASSIYKEKSTEKIYGAVDTKMALDRAIRCGIDTSASVYDERELFLQLFFVVIFR